MVGQWHTVDECLQRKIAQNSSNSPAEVEALAQLEKFVKLEKFGDAGAADGGAGEARAGLQGVWDEEAEAGRGGGGGGPQVSPPIHFEVPDSLELTYSTLDDFLRWVIVVPWL